MSKSKKWEIEGIKKKQTVIKAAKIILKSRFDHLIVTINSYFNEPSVENLHQVRIALRRVRYNMELFIACFDRKLLLKVYDSVESLQDHSGFVRDLDVFKENLNSLTEELGNADIPSTSTSSSRSVKSTPESPTEQDQITIYLDTTQAGSKKLLDYSGAVYVHTGVTTNHGQWQHVIGKWGDNQNQPELKKLSTNLYELAIGDPRQFYNINDPSEKIQQLTFVFRSEDSSIQTLQDNSVLKVDLDNSEAEAQSLKSERNIKMISSVLSKIEERRKELENNLELELMKFLQSKTLKEFYKLIK